jgi:transcription-repair coupling factor (superfamily II helicase)
MIQFSSKRESWYWHGQMEGRGLRINASVHGEFDALVATTIIESGLDVPNANTIFYGTMQIILACQICIKCEVE